MSKTILRKPEAFYDAFTRKAGDDFLTTTYCPGCGHGILHKLVAEALEDFGVQKKTMFVSPVGCSVFAYYYMDVGNVQAAHGRAPAVATALKRSNPESVVISYQGDGDLAAIGGAEILNAANRGEGITVFFVNNAIYGMTGGQMAPTTLIGQPTMTTPLGRTLENEGYPIRMSEIIATLEAPVYVDRVMLGDIKSIRQARKAVRKALEIQIEKNGFSFIEVLSACPSNLKMTPVDAQKWVREVLADYFPLGVKKDISATFPGKSKERHLLPLSEIPTILDIKESKINKDIIQNFSGKDFHEEIKIAGFGGQGVLSLGIVLSEMGMRHDFEVSWIPSYGPEMRGGTANCSVHLSNKKIGSPVVDRPTVLVAMNLPSIDKFEKDVMEGGYIFYDSSLINKAPKRNDLHVIAIPATKIADELGTTKIANMVIVGAMIEKLKLMSQEIVIDSIGEVIKNKKLIGINKQAIYKGIEFIKNLK
ncbi:MAG: 2-oxoacid:acceptor oxidoreductase family protein [Candidatus Marinimicrobia bacterium]|nr:2-oxoacid:acceptor oxidoreductase family protein [Candidatus Neomarinimicrobiota bacterium]